MAWPVKKRDIYSRVKPGRGFSHRPFIITVDEAVSAASEEVSLKRRTRCRGQRWVR